MSNASVVSSSTDPREKGSACYGPCARCERHWTRKVSEDEPGLCRYCLGALKARLERSHAA